MLIFPVPDDWVMVTVVPPMVRLLPWASLVVTVKVWVLVPSAVILDEVGVKVDCPASAGPAT